MKKIVMLDTYPCREEDFAFLSKYGRVVLYEHTMPAEIQDRIYDAEVVLTNKTKLTQTEFFKAEKLQYVGVTATGYNVVDVIAAKNRSILVTNVPSYGTDSVAQHTFALLLELTNHVGTFFEDVKKEIWSRSQRFCVVHYPIPELSGKILGIIGFGAIAQKVAKIARAFGMQIKAYSRTPKTIQGVYFCSLEELLKTSDVISLHCPATPETHKIINEKTLRLMKSSVLLINTSRGDLVDEVALYSALKSKAIGGAGLDVLVEEPPIDAHPLNKLENCIITPHVAWSGNAARARILQVTEENLAAFLSGRPQNVVN